MIWAEYYLIGTQIRDFPDYDSLTPDLKRVDADVNWAVTKDAFPWGTDAHLETTWQCDRRFPYPYQHPS
eukprot:4573-Amphidinium_carterae.1